MQKISINDIQREGFAVLHGKWGGGSAQTLIGINRKSLTVNRKYRIGYLSYPNPNLKNNIPDTRFYGYDSLVTGDASVMSGTFSTTGRLEQSVTKKEYIKKILQRFTIIRLIH